MINWIAVDSSALHFVLEKAWDQKMIKVLYSILYSKVTKHVIAFVMLCINSSYDSKYNFYSICNVIAMVLLLLGGT